MIPRFHRVVSDHRVLDRQRGKLLHIGGEERIAPNYQPASSRMAVEVLPVLNIRPVFQAEVPFTEPIGGGLSQNYSRHYQKSST
jgi:hypothetical protein